jgi:hypothetical protein
VNNFGEPTLVTEGGCLQVHIPMTFKRRGGRKEIVVSKGLGTGQTPTPKLDGALILAIARGHRWKNLLEIGRYANITELAQTMGVNGSYVGRLLNLTLLAPDIIEAILLGQDPGGLSLQRLYRLPLSWTEQRRVLGFPAK